MPDFVVTNWFGDIVSHPRAVAEAHSVDDIVAVLKDPVRYPSPVRAAGSNHSTTHCAVADGGTVLKIRMNRILHIGEDTLTVEAGALHLDMARELEKRKLQFFVNTEIGSLTAGSAACCGTKDASMPDEYGQVGSYVIAVKMVLPDGGFLEVTEEQQPELMRRVRSSYGTFGIIYEVTFRIRSLTPLAVYHQTFGLDEFIRRLPELKARNQSMMYYIFRSARKITVEFRRDNPDASGKPNRSGWKRRNNAWGRIGPKVVGFIWKFVPWPWLRYGLVDFFHVPWRLLLEHVVKSDNTIPGDQIIHYPAVSDDSRYTFSLFAFPEEQYPKVLSEFLDFCDAYRDKTGYRSNLIDVGYYIAKDQKATLSYSWDSAVMTIDPVSTGGEEWEKFLEAYNQFCSDRNGAPLPNQTRGITPAIAKRAYGDRLKEMVETRRTYDPNGRLLNDYFRSLFT